MAKKISGLLLIIITTLVISACDPERVDLPIEPGVFPTFTINITSFPELMLNGGAKDISSVPDYRQYGNRGIIVYRKNATTFLAFEKTCSFQPGDACATVGIHESNLFMIDVCCGSQFNFEGNPTGGLAWRPLLQYQTSVSGTQVTISSTVSNY